MASTRLRVLHSTATGMFDCPRMDVSATGMFDFPRMGDVRIAKFHPFRAHLMMSKKPHAFTANSLDHKPAADIAVVIGHDADSEQRMLPPERRPECHIIMRPEMIEGNKDKHIGGKTEVHVRSQAAIPH